MRKELLTFKEPKSPVSEIFRTLRTNIQFMNTNRKMKTLLITSTFPEEGKSWITANLAVTFAQAGKRVILIDADMRKGRQYKIFDILPKPGLSNYLSSMDADNMEMDENNLNIANYIQNTDVENLHVLVAGNVPPNPSELLVSTRMRGLLEELKEMCDLIIIDGTPCDLVSDSIILSRFVDSTIIVTAQKETKKDSLERIVKNIQNVGGRIAGVVVNKVDMSTKKYNQQYYYGSISGNCLSKKSKHRKKSDDMVANIFNFLQKSNNEEKDEKKPDTNKEIKDEIGDILDAVEEGENVRNLMDEFVDIERENNENFSSNEEVIDEQFENSKQFVEENNSTQVEENHEQTYFAEQEKSQTNYTEQENSQPSYIEQDNQQYDYNNQENAQSNDYTNNENQQYDNYNNQENQQYNDYINQENQQNENIEQNNTENKEYNSEYNNTENNQYNGEYNNIENNEYISETEQQQPETINYEDTTSNNNYDAYSNYNNYNNYNNNQYHSRNKKHRNKHRNRNRINNQNRVQENVGEQNNFNKYYDYDKTEENKQEKEQSVHIPSSTENISRSKADEIINLVNSYIESEKRKQERKF